MLQDVSHINLLLQLFVARDEQMVSSRLPATKAEAFVRQVELHVDEGHSTAVPLNSVTRLHDDLLPVLQPR